MPRPATTRVPLLHRRGDILRWTRECQAVYGLQHTQTDAAWPVLAVLSCVAACRSSRLPILPTAAVSFLDCLGCCRCVP